MSTSWFRILCAQDYNSTTRFFPCVLVSYTHFIFQHPSQQGVYARVKFVPFSSKGFISPKSNAINANKHDIILPFILYCVSVKYIERLLCPISNKYNIKFPYAGIPSCRSMPLHARACRFIFSQKY